MAPPRPIVAIEHLDFWNQNRQVLFDVSLAIPRHSTVALIGPTGAGKSALLAALHRQADHFESPGMPKFATISLEAKTYPCSVFENVAIGLREAGIDDEVTIETGVLDALHQLGLWRCLRDRLNEPALELPAWAQCRLGIARTLALHPDVLLFAEPVGPHDAMAAAVFEELIGDLRRHYTILFVAQSLEQAARLADYTAFLQAGHLIEFAHTRTLLASPQRPETEDFLSGTTGPRPRPSLSLVSHAQETTVANPRIMIIEDERGLVQTLSWYFNREGYETLVAHDGMEGLRKAQTHLPDVILLDVMLPGADGLTVCRELRAGERTRDIPIIMITAKSEEVDQIEGFAKGADDYVTKPFNNKILLQRVKALLRRTEGQADPSDVIEHLGVKIDRVRHRALLGNKKLELTPTEFRLLECLLRQPGRAFSRHQLMDSAIGEGLIVLERTIDVHIKTLRKKMEEVAGSDFEFIETVRGVGYRFREGKLEAT